MGFVGTESPNYTQMNPPPPTPKGIGQRDFDLQFFHNLNLPGPLTYVKIFSSLVKNSRSYLIFRFEKTDSPGYIKNFFLS